MKSAKALCSLIVLAALIAQAAEFGDQFTLFDIADKNFTLGWKKLSTDLNQPPSYVSPLDYLNGDWFTRIDVKSKPTTNRIRFNYCIEFGGHENCSNYRVLDFSKPGIYYSKIVNFSNWIIIKKHGDVKWDGKSKLDKFALQMRTASGAEMRSGHPELPIAFNRMELVMVAKGKTFTPPEHWHALDYQSCNPPGCQGEGSVSVFVPHEQNAARHKNVDVISTGNGTYRIASEEDIRHIEIADCQGRTIVSGRNAVSLALNPGVYIVRMLDKGGWTGQSVLLR